MNARRAKPKPVVDPKEELEQLRAELARRARAEVEAVWFELACRYDEAGAFAAFVRLMWSVVEPAALEWAPYMDVVCHALHRQMLGDPAYRNLLICLPPGYAKSLLVSVMAPAYEWIFNPSRRKLFFTADDDLSARDSRRTRNLLKSQVYLRLLAEVCRRTGRKPWAFEADQNEKRNFENSDQGFRQCLTLMGGVTGKRGDDLVVDDPIDVKALILGGPDAVNRRCEEAGSIIDMALETRVNDRRVARKTIVAQRTHPKDPGGRALAEGGWRVLCMPLRYEPKHPQVCPEDPRTVEGEFLHSTRDVEEDVRKLESKLGWQAPGQLQQRPVAAELLLIRPEHLAREYTCQPEEIAKRASQVWLTSDANQKGKATSDDSSIMVVARCTDGDHILDRIARPMGIVEYTRTMDSTIDRWAWVLAAKGGALIEDTANGATYLETSGRYRRGVTMHAFLPTRDTPGTDKSKAARGDYVVKTAAALRLVLPAAHVCPWGPQLRERLLGWPAIGRDDMDALSQLIMRWAREESGTGLAKAYTSTSIGGRR